MRTPLLLSALLFLAPLALAQAPEVSTLAVPEIRPGMKGYGKTVFKGGKIESFDFEVLGVQRNDSPGHDIIWVRASGGPLAETGILRGMSGSPCYIGNRLIGAMALAPEGGKEPIGGITPIGEMLDQLRDIPDAPSSRTPLLLPKMEPPKVLKAALRGEMIPLAELLGGGDTPRATAIPLPVFGTTLCEEARSFWDKVPFQFMAAPALSHTDGVEASPVEPGGMVAISFIQGDMDMMGSGTITYQSGKRIMLFGHPMYNLGQVDLPMWSASVAGLVPTYSSSFKLAVPVSPIGALRLDRNAGVAGVLGAEAKMVPLRVGLNLGGKKNLNFRFDMMDNPFLTPVLAATAVSQLLTTYIRSTGMQSLALQGNIKLAGQPAIQLDFMNADATSRRVASYVGSMLQAVMLNPFDRPVIEGISLNIKAEERLDLTSIANVRLLKSRVKRGENLPVLVTLQDFQGVRETATLNLFVPPSARPGKATLLVGDGLSLASADPDERAIEVGSFADVVRLLNNSLRNNHAYVLLVQQQPGAGLRGSRIEGIPPTVASLLGADGDSNDNRLARRIVGRALLPLEREVRGMASLDVDVE